MLVILLLLLQLAAAAQTTPKDCVRCLVDGNQYQAQYRLPIPYCPAGKTCADYYGNYYQLPDGSTEHGATAACATGQVFDGNDCITPKEEHGRQYFKVAIADMPKNFHTHVQVTGKITLVKHEGDGDTHMRLEDGHGHFITAECIPVLPCPMKPQVGQTVTVKGISRFDGEHKWYEVHPVESMKGN